MAELLRCSFCNRSQEETRALVDGPGVRICNECIALCAELITQEDRDEVRAVPPRVERTSIKKRDPQLLDRAIVELSKVIDADPGDARTRLKLGDLLAKRGDVQKAADQYVYVAAHYTSEGMLMKAVAVYKQVLKLSVSTDGIHGKLGELYERLGMVDPAAHHYETQASIYEQAGDPGGAAALRQRIKSIAKSAGTAPAMHEDKAAGEGREPEAKAARISPERACTFCKKSQHSVRKLIAGPTVYICNECIEVCVGVVSKR